jgi:hypothetical protein
MSLRGRPCVFFDLVCPPIFLITLLIPSNFSNVKQLSLEICKRTLGRLRYPGKLAVPAPHVAHVVLLVYYFELTKKCTRCLWEVVLVSFLTLSVLQYFWLPFWYLQTFLMSNNFPLRSVREHWVKQILRNNKGDTLSSDAKRKEHINTKTVVKHLSIWRKQRVKRHKDK